MAKIVFATEPSPITSEEEAVPFVLPYKSPANIVGTVVLCGMFISPDADRAVVEA